MNGNISSVKWGPFVEGDILDYTKLCATLKKYKPKAVMHFAALAYVEESVKNPLKYYRNNIFGSKSLFEAMISEKVFSLIFSSTCATYGVSEDKKITETSNQIPINPYGTSKLITEDLLRLPEYSNYINSISLRYFNASGADPDGEIGESHSPETHLIPRIIEVSKRLSNQIDIFGNDYNTPDGTCIRDYIHVTDIAKAHILALHHVFKSKRTDYFNLGTGRGYSIREIIKEVEKQSGEKIKINIKKEGMEIHPY